MNKSIQLVGTGIAVIFGAVLTVAPLAAAATAERPSRVCVDNGSAGECEPLVRPTALPGGSGQEVELRPATTGRLDAKDHPNYGQITPEYEPRGDAKDHPNYGPASAPGGGGGVIRRHHPTNPPV
jgi:hypothetical protein